MAKAASSKSDIEFICHTDRALLLVLNSLVVTSADTLHIESSLQDMRPSGTLEDRITFRTNHTIVPPPLIYFPNLQLHHPNIVEAMIDRT